MIIENSKNDIVLTSGLIGSTIGIILACVLVLFGLIEYQNNDTIFLLAFLSSIVACTTVGAFLGLSIAKKVELKNRQYGKTTNEVPNILVA
jgi:hypothetical protein